MSDRIIVRNLALFGYHGALESERASGQRFFVDIEIESDLSAAGNSDKVADTIHYGEVVVATTEVFNEAPVNLLEALCERICARILDRFELADAVSVEIRKPSAPIPAVFDWVAVKIRRERQQAPGARR